MKKFFMFVVSLIMIFSSFVYVYADAEFEEILNTGIYFPVDISSYSYWFVADKNNHLFFITGDAPYSIQGDSIRCYRAIHFPSSTTVNWYTYDYESEEWSYNEEGYSSFTVFNSLLHTMVLANHHIINENDGSIYFYKNYDASPIPTPTPSDRDYTGLFGNVIEAIDGLVSGIGDYILNGLEYLFVPQFDFEENFDCLKAELDNKFGSVIEMYQNLLFNIQQIEAKEFEGIKIDLSNFIVPIQGDIYILEPGPVNYYALRLRAWTSGLMIFFTVFYFLRKVLQIIRGSSPL